MCNESNERHKVGLPFRKKVQFTSNLQTYPEMCRTGVNLKIPPGFLASSAASATSPRKHDLEIGVKDRTRRFSEEPRVLRWGLPGCKKTFRRPTCTIV